MKFLGETIDRSLSRTGRCKSHSNYSLWLPVLSSLPCESALTLVLNADKLPQGPQGGGILMSATGLGAPLAERLRQAAMTLKFEAI